MSNTIKLKRSSVAGDIPLASDLEVGELAVNTADGLLFTKHTSNSVIEITGRSGEYFDFDTTSGDPSHLEGRVFYDEDRDALSYYTSVSSLKVRIGQDSLLRVYNNTGSTISAGSPVYLTGESGAIPTIAKASANTLDASYAIGILSQDLADASVGFAVTSGIVFFDTSGLTAGERAHVAPTAGTLQNAAPTYPYFATDVGIVLISSDTTGCLYVEIQNHAFEQLRITGNAHVDGNMTIDGNLTVSGTQTIASTESIAIASPFDYLNSGDSIGAANTSFTGSGLDDGSLVGHYNGTSTVTYYVKIDGTGTPDTFSWSKDNFSTTEATGVAITSDPVALDSGIKIEFNATTGHTVGDIWSGTATPVDSDTGLLSNRNTGGTGVGYTHVGFFFDASTSKWTLFDEYDPEPSHPIDTGDASFSLGTLVLDTVEGSLSGNATTASSLQTSRNFSITGDMTASAQSFDGSGNVTLTAAFNTQNLTAETSLSGDDEIVVYDISAGAHRRATITNAALQGQKGQKGDTGADGAAGATGDKGQKGDAGADGAAGTDGAKGQKGEVGATGATGPAGADGSAGATGDKGQKGEVGATGATGADGAKGQKGEVGATGAAGSDGAAGDKGQKGEVGATGSAGADGAKGQKGDTGSQGATGADGAKGQKGEVGSTGDTGATGAKGQKGEVGATGATGATGAAGADGADGAAGADGADGAKGQKGEVGATGDKGQKGEVGDTGTTGAKGQKGEVGAAGTNGADGADGAKGQKGEEGPNGGTYHYTNSGDEYAKYRLWGTSSSYGIGMVSAQTHGALNDYAMTFQMNDDNDRGFVWRDSAMTANQGAMSLTTTGELHVASGLSVGAGIDNTSNISVGATLDVWGTTNVHFNDIDFVNEITFGDGAGAVGTRLSSDGNDNYLKLTYEDTAGGGIKVYDGDATLQGALYGDGTGYFGLLNNDLQWAFRIAPLTEANILYNDGNAEFYVYTTYTYSPGSSRAPIFYDSNNTGYYVNPNSNTNLYGLYIQSFGRCQDNVRWYYGTGQDSSHWYDGTNNRLYLELESTCNDYRITDQAAATVRFTFARSSGDFTATGNITAYSDERLKDNIQTLDGSKVYEMRGVSFTKDGRAGSGVIAQEMEKIAPELVYDNDEYKSVSYGNIAGYLIEAAKDLKKEVELLKAEVADLKQQLEAKE